LRPILSSQQSPKLAKDFQGSDSQQKIEVNNFNAEIGDVKSNSIGRSSDLRKTSSLKFDIKTRRNSSSELKVPLLDLERVQNNLIGV
jgi:hypothetical protein